jgi:membrane protease YdiL (CAAX protease family)
MNEDIDPKSERLNVWPYLILPPIAFNVGALLLFGAMYATRPPTSADAFVSSFGQTQSILSLFIFLREWLFALVLIRRYRRSGLSIRVLFSRTKSLLDLRWRPAILLFVAFNALFILYVIYLIARMPALTYRGMNGIQIFLLIGLTPLTAAFTEELIWRGHIISGLELRGKRPWTAILISAVSFSLIHGVFLPDKLLATFLLGIVTGYYYVRERNLIPLMFTHWFVDVWSFGIFLFR